MIQVTYDGTTYHGVPSLPDAITDWLDFMCQHYPIVMRELLDHEIGDLGSWFSEGDDYNTPRNGCLVGSTALMMSKVMASTCQMSPSLQGVMYDRENPRWSADYYLIEFLVRCEPEYALTEKEWDDLTRPAYGTPDAYNTFPSDKNLIRLPEDRWTVARRVIELHRLTSAAGCTAPDYAEDLWYSFKDGEVKPGLEPDDDYSGFTQNLAIQAFKNYIKEKLG